MLQHTLNEENPNIYGHQWNIVTAYYLHNLPLAMTKNITPWQ